MNYIYKKISEEGIKKKYLKNIDTILSGSKMKNSKYQSSCYEVMVHKLCNEKCFFCSQDHKSRITEIKPNDLDIYKRILFGYKQGYGMIGFTGGEPLIHKNIINYIKFASKVGFKLIRIQTNGIMLGCPGFAKKCVESGVTLFKFSIHHYKNDIHDYLVGFPGALEKVNYGIKELKILGVRIGINIVLTKQNYKDLPEFLLHYLDMGVSSFVVIFPLYENSMLNEIGKVGFKFTDAIPYIIKSLHIFKKLGLKRILILNFPMCLLKGYENSIIRTFNGTAVLNLDGIKTNIDDNKAGGKKRVKICNKCEYNKICFGVDEKYLEYWGEDEFLEKQKELKYCFNLEDLKLKQYFSEDELCFFELLTKKEKLSVDDIIKLKGNIQICQDCDSMNKIISTGEILIKKGYIKKEMIKGKLFYIKNKKK